MCVVTEEADVKGRAGMKAMQKLCCRGNLSLNLKLFQNKVNVKNDQLPPPFCGWGRALSPSQTPSQSVRVTALEVETARRGDR